MAPASNHPPQIDPPTLSLYHDETYEQKVMAWDADGDPVTVRAPLLPTWMSFDTTTLTLSGAPGWRNIGVQSLVLTAFDGMVQTRDSFQITVNLAPCLRRAVFGPPSTSPYVMPFPVGTTPLVLQTYCGPGSHSRDNQLAYDFRTGFGTPVVAARAGVVSTVVDLWPDSDKDDSHFNYVLITHADGTFAFYAHLEHQSLTVHRGESVSQGQTIAAAGESGTPTGCVFEECGVLHFGVYNQSWRIDLPVNFSNADGSLDSLGGLVTGAFYTATTWNPPAP